MAIWGIDLGGTKIEGAVLASLQDTKPIIRERVFTQSDKGYEHILYQIKVLVDKMKTDSGLIPEKIGFGTPGELDPVLHTMKNCNSTALNDKPLKKDLEDLLGVTVELANDANCFALAETTWGIVKNKVPNARVVFGIIIGTGVGAGIVIDGKLWNGKHGIAGEWGHNFLDESGGKCYCGKTGCVEKVIAGPALQHFYTTISGSEKTLQEIVSHATQDEFAQQTLDRLHDMFAKALSVVVDILDPDVVVIGGGVGNIDSLYTKGKDALAKYIFNNRVDVDILKPSLGDSAGVFGAAALVG